MADDTQILFGLNKQDLFRATETLVLATVAILVILLVIRPLVKRALETARESALESAKLGYRPTTRLVVIDYSRLPIPKLWRHALLAYGFAAFCFGLGLGTGLSGFAAMLVHSLAATLQLRSP